MNASDTCYQRRVLRRTKGTYVHRTVDIPHDLQPATTDDDKAACVYCGKVMARQEAGDGRT